MKDRSSGRRPSGGRPKPTGSSNDRSSRPGPDRGAKASGARDRSERPSEGGESPRRDTSSRDDRSSSERPRRPGQGGRPGDRSARPGARSERPADREERPRREGGPQEKVRGSDRPRRPGQGGRPARVERPAPREERPEREGAGRSDRPASKRAGKRPPKFVRDGGPSSRAPRTGGHVSPERRSEGRPERAGAAREERGYRERDASTKRFVGRGPDRASKRGKRAEEESNDGMIRLNRYLSNAGVASRREADELIKAGVVQVNGVIVTEMGTKVGPGDRVHYGGQRLSTEKKRYVLLNKPKDFITTTDDPQDRRTVMALIDDACKERLYPVGRLDRHTTGVLLMTNDGDLAKKLTHPSHGAEKIYYATLDKAVTKADLEKLVQGIDLDDGLATADEASYVIGGTKKEVGLKLHMGKNRIVRRMFEAMGYDVVKLDRVVFAGLTKKDLPRGKWRHLTEKEVLFLSKRK